MVGVTLRACAFQRFVTSGLYIMPTAPAGYLATVYLLKRGAKATKQGQNEDKTDACRKGENRGENKNASTHPVAGLSALGTQLDSRQHSPEQKSSLHCIISLNCIASPHKHWHCIVAWCWV